MAFVGQPIRFADDPVELPWHSIDNALRLGAACKLAWLRTTTVQLPSVVTARESRRTTERIDSIRQMSAVYKNPR